MPDETESAGVARQITVIEAQLVAARHLNISASWREYCSMSCRRRPGVKRGATALRAYGASVLHKFAIAH
jgi:hypothetical protein